MDYGVIVDWEAVACCMGCKVTEIPPQLTDIFERLDEMIKDANGMSFGNREDFGLRSTQIISLVILLWKAGILK